MNEPNNQNNRIYEGYIPPAINPNKVEKPSWKKILAWLIVPGVLAIVFVVAAFVIFYNTITGGFRAKNIEVKYSTNPPYWNVYGREIHGTAAKTLKGDVFEIEVQSDDGYLEITVTDVETEEVLLIRSFTRSGNWTVNADGKRVKFEVTARSFSGHFLIYEDY
ncbi:MAG: hypothetical protein K2N06_04005 [Oscillospiraceae bacterium]|nr:hypothetical protein [Oscillospiraceae bacterium]